LTEKNKSFNSQDIEFSKKITHCNTLLLRSFEMPCIAWHPL